MENKLLVVLCLLIFCSCSKEIKQIKEPQIKLKRIIKTENEKSIPVDIVFKSDEIFILDWGIKNIVKVNSKNQFELLENFELVHPGAIEFVGGNLVVTDRFFRTANLFSQQGKFLTNLIFEDYRLNSLLIHKNNFVLRTRNYKYETEKSLTGIINLNGEVVKNVGEIIPVKGMITDKVLMNEVEIAANYRYLVAANKYHNPLIRIYDLETGENRGEIKYQLSYSLEDYIDKEKEDLYKNYSFLYSLAADQKYIYAVVKRRLANKRECGIGRFISDEKGVYLLENKVRSSETDLNELLIFSLQGKLIKRIELNIFCDKMEIHNSRLYFIDSFVGKKIYEYEIEIK